MLNNIVYLGSCKSINISKIQAVNGKLWKTDRAVGGNLLMDGLALHASRDWISLERV